MKILGSKKIVELRESLREKGLEAALFVNNEPVLDTNISYLSGFSGMLNGALIVSHEDVRLITTELDYERAQMQAHVDEIFRCKNSLNLYQSIRNHCKKYKKMGVVKNKFTVEMSERIGLKPSGMIDVSVMMERCRMVKEPDEIDNIRKCADICNSGLKFLEGFIREGVKENEVAAELERILKIRGSEYPPFETIVTSGSRSRFIHPNPPASDMPIKQGLGLVDFGAVHKNYSTDVTLPFTVGKLNERQQQMTDVVLSLWDDIIKMIRPGVKTNTIHDIFENRLKKYGFDVKHSLGHSLGLEVHEYPSVSGTEVELKEGMIIAIEPGVYEKNTGGCRLENTILVKKNGCEELTKSKLIRV